MRVYATEDLAFMIRSFQLPLFTFHLPFEHLCAHDGGALASPIHHMPCTMYKSTTIPTCARVHVCTGPSAVGRTTCAILEELPQALLSAYAFAFCTSNGVKATLFLVVLLVVMLVVVMNIHWRQKHAMRRQHLIHSQGTIASTPIHFHSHAFPFLRCVPH